MMLMTAATAGSSAQQREYRRLLLTLGLIPALGTRADLVDPRCRGTAGPHFPPLPRLTRPRQWPEGGGPRGTTPQGD